MTGETCFENLIVMREKNVLSPFQNLCQDIAPRGIVTSIAVHRLRKKTLFWEAGKSL